MIYKKGSCCSLDSIVNLILRLRLLSIFNNSSDDILFSSSNMIHSSRYLSQLSSIYFRIVISYFHSIIVYNFISKYPNTSVAYVGANIVPIAVPISCKKLSPLKV